MHKILNSYRIWQWDKLFSHYTNWTIELFSNWHKFLTAFKFHHTVRSTDAYLFIFDVWWWWCYSIPSEGWWCGGTSRRPNSRATPQGLDQREKMEEVVPKMARRDSQGGGESNPAEGVRRRCMKNSSSVSSCISKRTKEGCDRGSEVETVHSG